MLLRRKKFLFSFIAFLLLAAYQYINGPDLAQRTLLNQNKPEVQGTETERVKAQVNRVVDGDTLEVLLDNKKQKIRVIGIDTPEVVDPRRPVQCFGKEASNYAKELLNGQTVYLEADNTQGDRDNYKRLLRYVWIDNGQVDFGKQMIGKGYAHEYTYNLPYKYRESYKDAEQKARDDKVGLWADNACVQDSSR